MGRKNPWFFSKQVHVFLSILSTLLRRINSVHVLGILLESAYRVWYRYYTLWADSMSLISGKGFKRGTTQFWFRIIIMWHELGLRHLFGLNYCEDCYIIWVNWPKSELVCSWIQLLLIPRLQGRPLGSTKFLKNS